MNDLLRPPPAPLTPPMPTAFTSRRRHPVSLGVIHSISQFIKWPHVPAGKVDAGQWLTKNVPGRPADDNVSADALVRVDGRITLLNEHEEDRYTWHAGKSFWPDIDDPELRTRLNRISVGVEVEVEGTYNWPEFVERIKDPDAYNLIQYRSLGWLTACRWAIPFDLDPEDFVRHSQISGDDVRGPGKGKPDPGVGFDWRIWLEFHTGYYEAYKDRL